MRSVDKLDFALLRVEYLDGTASITACLSFLMLRGNFHLTHERGI